MAEINQLTLQFDEKRFYHDLCSKLERCVLDIAIKLNVDMGFNAKSSVVKNSIKTVYDFSNFSNLINYGYWLIEAKVGSTSWKAYLENYGTGSKMNIAANNGFDRYTASEYWNPVRNSKTVVGREKGWYKTLDWETANPVKEVWRYSEGNYAGENLEEIKKTMPNGGKTTMFKPQEGSLFMENAFSMFREDFEVELRNTLKSMNLNDYLITGK